MILPSVHELRSFIAKFIAKEQISWWLLVEPGRMFKILHRYRFLHFLIVGGGGAILGLGLTWLFTTFVFGLEGYFSAYLIGTSLGLLFNFTMYTIVIFRTARSHMRRLVVYFVYMVGIILIQATLVRSLTPLVGIQLYLLVIAAVIAFFSVVNFLAFKLSIFKERE